jgi:hypothetical protein
MADAGIHADRHLAVDIHLNVDQRGGLCLRSGAQRFYEKLIGFSFPMIFSGFADVCEWFDNKDRAIPYRG